MGVIVLVVLLLLLLGFLQAWPNRRTWGYRPIELLGVVIVLVVVLLLTGRI